jgi:hypothetical protein
MPTSKAYIDGDSGWLSNIFEVFTRADNTNDNLSDSGEGFRS